MDTHEHNRRAWNRDAASGQCRWSQPVDAATVRRARAGDWSVILTPNRPVPRDWFGVIHGASVLCLASGGGQQAPVLAAAGAEVTSFDAAEAQLDLDAAVAAREGLTLTTRRGDMADLSAFADAAFDLVFHPVANVFVPDVLPVWRECQRVLRPGGRLLAGFMNPAYFLFDHQALAAGEPPVAVFELPYADTTHLPPERLEAWVAAGEALEFGHSLDAQIGGQIAAGFVIAGFYEDRWDAAATPLDRFMPTSMATLAIKPGAGGAGEGTGLAAPRGVARW